jgi:hypothetical protein
MGAFARGEIIQKGMLASLYLSKCSFTTVRVLMRPGYIRELQSIMAGKAFLQGSPMKRVQHLT